MRVLLTVRGRLVSQVLRDLLRSHGRSFSPVSLDKALTAKDKPVVVYWTPEWTEEAQEEFDRLARADVLPFAICQDFGKFRRRLAILQQGARGVATEDADDLEALVLQIGRIAGEREESQWQLGRMDFDAPERCLYDEGVRVPLSATEARLLKRLCVAAADDPQSRLSARQLTRELGGLDGDLASKVSSVRTYVGKLRQKLDDDPKQPGLLRHDHMGYYVALRKERARSV